MRVAVYGPGGVGGYFGGRLAEAGEEVAFIARGAHLAAIRAHGLRVSSVAGDFVARPSEVTDDPETVGPVDLVIVGVKTWQLADAGAAMRPLVGGDTMVLPLQNGIEAPDLLAATLGARHVLGGLCQIFVFVAEPGHIRHAGVEPYLAFGELDGGISPRVEALREAFARARGVTAEAVADVRIALWEKFLFITALSGTTSLVRAPIGVVRGQAETRRLLERALEEIRAVALAHGVALPADSVARTLARIDGLPAEATPSMQRDVLAGRPSELDAQVGAVVRLGKRHGVPVPLHDVIYAALLPQERRARGELSFDSHA